MRIKKDKDKAPPTPEELLEAKVDAMMAPERPDQKPAPKSEAVPNPELPPLDIFQDPRTAPEVPIGLLQKIGVKETKAVEPQPAPEQQDTASEPAAASVEMDDASIDAAVDDIVAHEGDTVLEAEDKAAEEATVSAAPVKKTRHHPLFWALISTIAIFAILAAILLATGGNPSFPGSSTVQGWWHSLQKKI